jgi:hypothetical protein
MAESSAAAAHGSVNEPEQHHGSYTNPEVRYERSDIGARGVVIFVVVLALGIIISGGLISCLYYAYEQRDAQINARESLPLERGEQGRLPSAPRLEGIDPNEDPGRAWPAPVDTESPAPWFGYNVRVVPAEGPIDPNTDAEQRDRLAAQAMARKLQKVDAKLSELAGKLPARKVGIPPDEFRKAAGDGNAGRSAGEKSP